MPKTKPLLKPQWLKFIQEYIILGNAAEAARRAGYAEKWADRMGHALIENNRVKAEINRQVTKTLSHRDVTKKRILSELARVAFGSLDDVATWSKTSVKFIASKDLDRGAKAAIQEISQKTGNTNERKIKLHDKVKALDTLGKYMNLDKGEVDEGKNEIKLKYGFKRSPEQSKDGSKSDV